MFNMIVGKGITHMAKKGLYVSFIVVFNEMDFPFLKIRRKIISFHGLNGQFSTEFK